MRRSTIFTILLAMTGCDLSEGGRLDDRSCSDEREKSDGGSEREKFPTVTVRDQHPVLGADTEHGTDEGSGGQWSTDGDMGQDQGGGENTGGDSADAGSGDGESKASADEGPSDKSDEDGEHSDTCAPAEYLQALECIRRIEVHQVCRAKSGAKSNGDHDSYACSAHFDCDPDWNARRHWQAAQCMDSCKKSHPEDYTRSLCAIEEHAYFRACLIWTGFTCVDPNDALESESVANCHTVAAFHRDQCQLAGHLSEVPEWALHPPLMACDSDEASEAIACRGYWDGLADRKQSECESRERPRITIDWQAETGSSGEPPADFVDCEMIRRCDGVHQLEFSDEAVACVSTCEDSHLDEMIDASCHGLGFQRSRGCLKSVSCFDLSGLNDAEACTADASDFVDQCIAVD